jgi:16S rRNA (adenine1518-N6/adenine1519-N6)-dimethyltransferase
MQHKPLKKFGQNFLTQPAIAGKIVAALDISSADHILEIGPGTGVLTSIIIDKTPAAFTAVEIDRNLAAELREKYPHTMHLLQEDFLTINLSTLHKTKKLKIIGNIPYNITSPILFKLIDHYREIDCAVLMMQKEVAKRIVANSGSKDYGILSVILQTFASVEYLFDVAKNNFIPVPKVDSAIVKFTFVPQITGIDNLELYRRIIRSVFNYRRKMLRNSLIRIFDQSIVTSLNSFDLTRRPEQLSISDFKKLANTINTLI